MENFYPDNSYIMAPLTDYTDYPFRNSIRRHGAKYMFTQMIDAGALVWSKRTGKRLAEKNEKIITRRSNEDWVGVQLLGNQPEIIAEAVEILNDYDFDVLDLNMGCPMKKVTKRGCGAAMVDNQDLALWCLDTMIAKSRIPVTGKIRIIDYDNPEPNINWAKRLQNTGIKALTVHGRIRTAIYSGDPSFAVLKAIDEVLDIQVIANGGIMCADDALTMKEKSGMNCGMVARGAIGNPWIFEELKPEFMAKIDALRKAGKSVPKFAPSHQQLIDEMKLNFTEMVEFHGEETATRVARKVILSYLKGRGYSSTWKNQVGQLATADAYNSFFTELEKVRPAEKYCESVTFYEDF